MQFHELALWQCRQSATYPAMCTARCAWGRLNTDTARAQHGYSAEPEVREILTIAVEPEMHVHPNEALAALSDKIGRTNEDFEVVHHVHDKAPIEPLRFE